MSRAASGVALALLSSLAMLWLPGTSAADTAAVQARDNFFVPGDLRIEVGDTVEWNNAGSRAHTITSDAGMFDSGRLGQGQGFRFRFGSEGYYPYHCRLHGSPKTGMWGIITVGDPPRATQRPRIHVPGDHGTIQRAVNRAPSGATVVIAPGIYREDIVVRTPDLVIKGVDRFRTVIHGGDSMNTGISVEDADDVVIKNLTIRNFLGSGIDIRGASGFTVSRVDSIKNRTYGVHAVGSFDGAVRRSFIWGSGDSGLSISDCNMCSTIVRSTRVLHSDLGIATGNASGVVVKDSEVRRNGTGIAAFSFDGPADPGAQSLTLVGNRVVENNYATVPAGPSPRSYGLPYGTGIWLAGAATTVVRDNSIVDNERYGVLVSGSTDGTASSRWNTTIFNRVRGSTYELAWDGIGRDVCFSDNDIIGTTAPDDIQIRYPCSGRPFEGEPFQPVIADVAAALADTEREQVEPPEPSRPSCQKGAPGCKR